MLLGQQPVNFAGFLYLMDEPLHSFINLSIVIHFMKQDVKSVTSSQAWIRDLAFNVWIRVWGPLTIEPSGMETRRPSFN